LLWKTIITERSGYHEFTRKVEVYVVSIEDALFVKRLQILPGRQLKVKSDNSAYDPFIISMESDNFHIVGKVIWAGSLLEGLK
jgi:phage repressor protein C with HTH and peptisase S24 domain